MSNCTNEQDSVATGDHSGRHFAMAMYDKEMDFPTRHLPPTRRYILATVPRSGSTLCSIRLWQSGQLGSPLEYLNFQMAAGVFGRFGYALGDDGRPKGVAQLSTYWKNLQQLRTSPNGVFGYKLFICNLTCLANRYSEFLSTISPTHVVYLTRMDLLGQAISYYRAHTSKAWFGGVRITQSPDYDFKRIQSCLISICTQMAVWEQLFKRWEVTPLRIYYEQLCHHPRQVVVSIKDHMSVTHDPSAMLSLPLIIRQADHKTGEWRARFVNDAAAQADSLAA
jgi:LPS sulfotransferase NodH